jgi:predicted ATPase
MPTPRRDRSAASDTSPRRQAKLPGNASYPRANLPPQLTSFVGRERELSEVARLLDSTRLLTLIGVGGCGKTRLALQAATIQADTFADGVCWVDLAGLSEPALVTQSVAQALDLREASRESLLETLANYLKAKRLLLVLDNCEHLLAACHELVEALLPECPMLKVLATSREPLGVVGESTWLVPALSLPDITRLPQRDDQVSDELTRYDAIRLFVERAHAVLPIFTLTNQNQAAVVQVCQQLDGLPLAIELAAARVNVLAVQQIAERLDDRFALLTNGNRTALIPRHQTLRATLDWSYDLLLGQERILFRRMSVFAGGFTLDAAEAICSDGGVEQKEVLNLLSHLIDKSLVVADTQGSSEARYHLLETIRQYAMEKLQGSNEEAQTRNRQLDYFVKLAEEAEVHLDSAEQIAWFDRLEVDHDNLRAVLRWSIESGAVIEGLRLAGALYYFWYVRGYMGEGRECLTALLTRPEAATRTAVRAKALNAAVGLLQWEQRHHAEALPLLEESLSIGQEVGDKLNIARSLRLMGILAFDQGEYATARSFAEEGLTLLRALDHKPGIARILYFLGDVALHQGNSEQAQVLYEESLSLFQILDEKNQLAYVLRRLGLVACYRRNWPAAVMQLHESIKLNQEVGSQGGIAACLATLAAVSAANRTDSPRCAIAGSSGSPDCIESCATDGTRPRSI